MAKKKITWEWGDHDEQIIVRKEKGKLTLDEIWSFLQEREQLNAFGVNSLAVILFRMREREYPGWDHEEPEGDAQDIYILSDGSKCICGRTELWMQYCPDCGRKLIENRKEVTV